MSTFQFTLIVDGPDLQEAPFIDLLFDAGCDDATVGCSDGVQFVDFDREADAFDDAILSAVDDLEKLQGVRVVRIADAGLASLADIAARLGRTRESVRLLVSGARGPGGFPKPVTDPRGRYRLWRWSEVAHWFQAYQGEVPAIGDDGVAALYNAALEFRHGRHLLERSDPVALGELMRVPSSRAPAGPEQSSAERSERSVTNIAGPGDEPASSTQPATSVATDVASTGRCALCRRPIPPGKRSREHVIPNAIGGRKTVLGFICVDCNSTTGATWDRDLCLQLRPLCTLLNIRRQRGTTQPVAVETRTGGTFLIHPDGRMTIRGPVFSERVREGQKEISIQAPSMKELKRMLPGLARKYPEIDVDQILARATPRREYLEDPLPIPLTFGGESAGRSIVKSCLALVHEAGLHLSDCEHAHEYLLNEGQPCFGYYNETDLVSNRPDNVFFHCVHVSGDPVSHRVLGYVEYFGFMRIVLGLSSHYDGEPFSCGYAVDPIGGEEQDIQVNLTLTHEDVTAAYAHEKLDTENLKSSLASLLEFYMERSIGNAISDASADAVEYAFANCGAQPGQELTDQQLEKLSRLLLERMEPLLVHLLSRPAFVSNATRGVRRRGKR